MIFSKRYINKKSVSLVFLCGIFTFHSLFSQDLARYIKEGQTDSVNYFLEQGNDINGVYNGFTPLEIAIRSNQSEMVKYLIDHKADLNLMNNRLRPLQFAIYFSSIYHTNDIVEMLINNGADINLKGQTGNTPLLFACKLNNGPVARLLFEKGADVTQRDKNGLDFYFHVLHGNDMDLIKYFSERGFPIPRTHSSKDGPYIKWGDGDMMEVIYIKYDSLSDKAVLAKDLVGLDGLKKSNPVFRNINIRELKPDDFKPEKAVYKKVSKIFAVSDIHGNYNAFTRLLKKSKVINEDLNWIWGDGHLVICGDVFDRGDKVTDCLWLIFKLEKQAEENGGKVHYLLGNHELMITRDDEKFYVNDKYILPCAKIGIDYHDLFGQDYVLGSWIRSKNVVEKINNILFVHGGIPPDFVDKDQSIDKMNNEIHEYYSENQNPTGSSGMEMALQPVWYRGYFENGDIHETVEKQLKYYKADKIVVGHTPVSSISPIQNGNVVAIGIPYDVKNAVVEGLLIEKEQFYSINEYGVKKDLFPTQSAK